jgi:Kef-type K+ transport system membrane component KefB
MTPLFYLAIILLGGVLFGRLVKYLRLPNVTGYIICGLIFGPYVLNIIPQSTVISFSIFSDVALGFIAFTIGCEFKGSYLKRVGSMPIVIAIFESVVAVILVTIGLYVYTRDFSFSLMLGSIAAATAPAATILIIKQYRAKGETTETLMSVVALDDAVAIICFGLAMAAVKFLSSTGSNMLLNILTPFYEIGISIVIGFVLGILFELPLKMFKKTSNRTCLIIAFVFVCVGLTNLVGGSPLLGCMAFGCTFININKKGFEIQDIVDIITPPIFVIFFVESGASLDITILPSLGIVGIIYILFRVIGKIFGAYTGAVITKAPQNVKKYLGLALIPQAGVAIGLSLLFEQAYPAIGGSIKAVILCATLIYEIIGPAVSKYALVKAGDITVEKMLQK